MKKVFFPTTMTYYEHTYEGGKVYELDDSICPGYVDRWLRRGCTLVESEKVVEEAEKESEHIEEVSTVEVAPVEEEIPIESKKPVTKRKSKK